jgi:hypothetical protein
MPQTSFHATMIRAWRLKRVLDIDIDACCRCGAPVRAFATPAYSGVYLQIVNFPYE